MASTVDEITHDPEADAAYIRLIKTDNDERLTTVPLQNRSINLDFDQENHLVGVEVLNASEYLPSEFLDEAHEL